MGALAVIALPVVKRFWAGLLEEFVTQLTVSAGVTLGEEAVKHYFKTLEKKPKRRVSKPAKRRKR